MRPSGLLLSVILHCTAIGTAVAVAGFAMARPVLVAPSVRILSSAASVPVPPDVELPAIAAEASVDDPRVAPFELEPSPLAPPEPGELVVEPAARGEVPWRARVIREAPLPTPLPPAAAPPSPPTPTPQARVDASPLADNPPPEYPANERALGREGEVLVRVRLDERGVVLAVELARPSPHPGLNREALRAVRGWRFAPASEHGRPVASETEVPIVFRLVLQ